MTTHREDYVRLNRSQMLQLTLRWERATYVASAQVHTLRSITETIVKPITSTAHTVIEARSAPQFKRLAFQMFARHHRNAFDKGDHDHLMETEDDDTD